MLLNNVKRGGEIGQQFWNLGLINNVDKLMPTNKNYNLVGLLKGPEDRSGFENPTKTEFFIKYY
jgi:hypothetical protein